MSSNGSFHEREFFAAERRDSDVFALESFQNDALWRNFSQPDAQEKVCFIEEKITISKYAGSENGVPNFYFRNRS